MLNTSCLIGSVFCTHLNSIKQVFWSRNRELDCIVAPLHFLNSKKRQVSTVAFFQIKAVLVLCRRTLKYSTGYVRTPIYWKYCAHVLFVVYIALYIQYFYFTKEPGFPMSNMLGLTRLTYQSPGTRHEQNGIIFNRGSRHRV